MKKLKSYLALLICVVFLIPTTVSALIDFPYSQPPVHLYVNGAVSVGGNTKVISVDYRGEDFAATQLSLTLQSENPAAVQLQYHTLQGCNGATAVRNANGVIEVSNPNGIQNGQLFTITALIHKEVTPQNPIELQGRIEKHPTNGKEVHKGIFHNGAVIAPTQDATFTIDTVPEADLVRVDIALMQPYTYIGAIQFDFDYDETYLEIVKSPFTGQFLTLSELDGTANHGAWAVNEKTLLFAASTADGIRASGPFITAFFRVVQDIPLGQTAQISAILDLAPVSCLYSDTTYNTIIVNGGVVGQEGIPGNKLFDGQETGIQAIVSETDPLHEADLVTQLVEQTPDRQVFAIGFEKDGKEQQPQEPVVIRLPVPEGMTGDTCHIYRTEEDGTLTDMMAASHKNYLTFEAEHGSSYTISAQAMDADPVDLSAYRMTMGDINRDRFINANDALLSLKKAVHLIDFTPVQHATADVNGDSAVDAKDALVILQYAVAKIETWPL